MLFSTLSVFGAVPKAKAWATDGKYTWPISTDHSVTAGWYYSNGNWHGATDFAASIGTQVVAIAAGTVIQAVDNGCGGSHIGGSPACPYGSNCKAANIGYANYIMIKHYDGTYSVYGHLKTGSFTVKAGDVVEQGTPIAQTGAAGKATGPHLHLELRTGGPEKAVISDAARKPYSVNPQDYLTKKYVCNGNVIGEGDSLGCTTAYAGWYQETGKGGANVNSNHTKNWGSQVGVINEGQYVYVSKATGTGSGNLGHITYNGVERYIAMGLFKRMSGDPIGSVDSYGADAGAVWVNGWAFDWDNCESQLTIEVCLDDNVILRGTANTERSDVNSTYSSVVGSYHGFSLRASTNLTGSHKMDIYAVNVGSGTNKCIGSVWVNIPVSDTTGPEISNVQVTNVTNKGYDVSCTVTDPSGVDRVQFPTWTDANGQDDLLSDWSTNQKARGTQNGNTWTFHVDIADHNNEGGTYCTDIHAYDKYGNDSGWNAPRVYVDTEAPVISNVQVTNITTEGYDVSCTVTDNVGVNRVVFPTWTVLNDQDEIASEWWNADHTATRGTRNGDVWTFHVNIADHNNERGAYLTHIYAYDDAGNRICSTDAGLIEVPEPYPTITFDACGGTAEFTEKQLEYHEDGMTYGALPEAWMDGYVFDGWYTDAVGGTRVSRSTAYTDKGNTTLYAHWMAVDTSAASGWSLQDGTLIIMAQGAMQDYTSAVQVPWFQNRADIKKIVVQNGVTTIGDYAFYGCENVTSVSLPSTVTQIGKLAFYGCKSLSSLALPDSVTVVEDYAFAKASGLRTIVFKGSAPALGAGIFADVSAEVCYPAGDASWTADVQQSYTGNVRWVGRDTALLTAQDSELQLDDPVLEALLADSCV